MPFSAPRWQYSIYVRIRQDRQSLQTRSTSFRFVEPSNHGSTDWWWSSQSPWRCLVHGLEQLTTILFYTLNYDVERHNEARKFDSFQHFCVASRATSPVIRTSLFHWWS